MRKSLGTSAIALLLAVPLIANDAGPIRLDEGPSESSPAGGEATPQFLTEAAAAASDSETIRRVVVFSEPYTVVDEKTGRHKTIYREISRVLTQKVPTEPAQIEAARKRLKELQDQRIDRLSAQEIAAEELDLTFAEKEREAWVKLQGIRDLLKKVATEYPSTEASRIAAEAHNLIPATETPPKPAIGPTKLPYSGHPPAVRAQ